jgi:hypothetical protein
MWYLWNERLCRMLWHFSDSCYAGYDAGGQQTGRSHRLRTSRYEYGVTDKPWVRLQLIYNDTGTRSSCDNRDILLYYRENSRSSWETERELDRLYAPQHRTDNPVCAATKRSKLLIIRVYLFVHVFRYSSVQDVSKSFYKVFLFSRIL